MRTPKISALHRLIDWLNARLDGKSKIPISSEIDNSPLGNNPWLTGFIESDGNFYCSFNLAPRRGTKGIAGIVKSYMRISQNQIYKTSSDTLLVGVAANYSNSQIMGEIREFLNVKTVNEIKRIKKDYVELAYEVRTTKKASCDILINYLSAYPLFSSKHQDFLDWREIHRIRLSRCLPSFA